MGWKVEKGTRDSSRSCLSSLFRQQPMGAPCSWIFLALFHPEPLVTGVSCAGHVIAVDFYWLQNHASTGCPRWLSCLPEAQSSTPTGLMWEVSSHVLLDKKVCLVKLAAFGLVGNNI